jgi:Zn-finger nucleic acid-binding protein
MRCPNCKFGLVVSDRHGSTTARSVAEVWLDRGELDKIRIVVGVSFGS